MFASVHSVQASAPQLYLARAELERLGRTDEHNALVAFLDSLTPTTMVSGAMLTANARQSGRYR